jgi:hypothetical protein
MGASKAVPRASRPSPDVASFGNFGERGFVMRLDRSKDGLLNSVLPLGFDASLQQVEGRFSE